ncbi:hypothetical protein [Arsenophonus nasoniae]|uniref:Uncharacterized protein n=1 Tax=Arsenophonus nasoniae TaxID=638 RepID=A0AA95GCJ5_9GAMM|nr:hypothetical protein [Arsenophonus nasoniae]WGL96546.1 hypothetical protein QE207_08420 [Arsenophonus nasoniae]
MAAIKEINIGKSPDDGTGDLIRDAFSKTNDNFKALNEMPDLSDPVDKLTQRVIELEKIPAQIEGLTKRVVELEKLPEALNTLTKRVEALEKNNSADKETK